MLEKVILDCDNTMGLPFHEVDDGLALLYLLRIPEIDLLGVTTTFGNGSLKQVLHQTVNLLADLGSELDVYEGEDRKRKGKETPAARYLVEQAQKWGRDLTIIATGPMGNLAVASRLDQAGHLHGRKNASTEDRVA
jgi:purine nucleosidase